MGMLLDSQHTMVEAVFHALQYSLNFSAFADAPGGMGKTFRFNLLLAAVRAQGQIALVVASSNIAATLLTRGCTFHSHFKAPLQPDATSVCNIKSQSILAGVIHCAKLIIWDESTMAHHHLLEAFDRNLYDLMDSDLPFSIFHLHENMRLHQNGESPEAAHYGELAVYAADSQWMSERTILAPLNSAIDEINKMYEKY